MMAGNYQLSAGSITVRPELLSIDTEHAVFGTHPAAGGIDVLHPALQVAAIGVDDSLAFSTHRRNDVHAIVVAAPDVVRPEAIDPQEDGRWLNLGTVGTLFSARSLRRHCCCEERRAWRVSARRDSRSDRKIAQRRVCSYPMCKKRLTIMLLLLVNNSHG